MTPRPHLDNIGQYSKEAIAWEIIRHPEYRPERIDPDHYIIGKSDPLAEVVLLMGRHNKSALVTMYESLYNTAALRSAAN